MDTIRFAIGEIPSVEHLVSLYRSVHWAQADCPEDLHRAVSQSQWVATAWHQGRLVGLLRVLTDGVFTAFFKDFLVHPDYQHQGIAKELMDRYDVEFGDYHDQIAVLDTEWAKEKFEKRGFRTEGMAVSRVRPISVCH